MLKLNAEQILGIMIAIAGVLVELAPLLLLLNFSAFAITIPSSSIQLVLSPAQWGAVLIVVGGAIFAFSAHHARQRRAITALPDFARFSQPAGLFGLAMIAVALVVPFLISSIYGVLGTVFILLTGWFWFMLFLIGIISLIAAFFMKGNGGTRTG